MEAVIAVSISDFEESIADCFGGDEGFDKNDDHGTVVGPRMEQACEA